MEEKERTPLYRVESGVATITMNRPETLNSFTPDFVHEIEDAVIRAEADCFITGEIHYHDFFGHDGEILMVSMGHYESEQFTPCIFERLLREQFPTLRVEHTQVNTNPIQTL